MSGSAPSLAAADIIDVRRFCGYAMDDAALDPRLATLTAEMVAVVQVQLGQLRSLETAIITASSKLSVSRAAVFVRNQTDIADREALLYTWRLKLCNTLSVIPGAFLGAVGIGSGGAGLAPVALVV